MREHFPEILNSGVTVVTGTDAVLKDARVWPVAREVETLTEYGVSPLMAIHAGTLAGARVLGIDRETGEIAAGKQADILVVGGDASSDISALGTVRSVWKDGIQAL